MNIAGLKEGDSLKPLILGPVSRLELIKYAGASGDFNPIHTIDEEAKKIGLPGIIAHGMLTMGRMARLFSSYLTQGYITEFSTRFAGMVFLGDVITYEAKVIEIESSTKTFLIIVKNQEDKLIAKGQLKFRLFE